MIGIEFAVFVIALTAAGSMQEDSEDNGYISIDKQIQIIADVNNSQDRVQPFAYLVQIQDENDVTISLAWLTGALSPKQTLSPALSWIPEKSGTYSATIFVWESIDNPDALSLPLNLQINVR